MGEVGNAKTLERKDFKLIFDFLLEKVEIAKTQEGQGQKNTKCRAKELILGEVGVAKTEDRKDFNSFLIFYRRNVKIAKTHERQGQRAHLGGGW